MNREQVPHAVGVEGIARLSDGTEYGRGRIISYSPVPAFEIEREDGARFSWRHDMVDVAPVAQ